MPEKIIRDPVHDVIAFRTERPADALLFRLLNAGEFQRLRRIRQLGLASLAYPCADHSRYSHSLGVMETARKMLAQLGRSFAIDEADELACLAASLLHDLGHGPFSHVFERVGGIEHEKLTRRIIQDNTSEVHQILADYDRSLPARITGLLQGEGPRPMFSDILASQLDADRLDYLLRDNLMTGSRYGDYDLTLASGQTTFEASSYLYDMNVNADAYLVLTDRQASNVAYVYGTQLSADGTLLFQPSTGGIDVFDGRLGTLRSRIALPFDLSQNYDALVADGRDNVLIAITGSTGSGIAVVDLTSLHESAPLPYGASIFHGTSPCCSTNQTESGPHRGMTGREPHLLPKFRVPHVTDWILPRKLEPQRSKTGP